HPGQSPGRDWQALARTGCAPGGKHAARLATEVRMNYQPLYPTPPLLPQGSPLLAESSLAESSLEESPLVQQRWLSDQRLVTFIVVTSVCYQLLLCLL